MLTSKKCKVLLKHESIMLNLIYLDTPVSLFMLMKPPLGNARTHVDT